MQANETLGAAVAGVSSRRDASRPHTRRRPTNKHVLGLLTSILVAGACTEEETMVGPSDLEFIDEVVAGVSGPIAAIAVTPDLPIVAAGSTVQLTARAVDQSGNAVQPQPSFIWTSLKTSVATVNSTGRVTAIKVGTASIRARSGSFNGYETVTVVPRIAQVILAPAGTTIPTGQTAQFTVSARDSAGTSIPITSPVRWGFTAPTVGRVDSTGVVTGLSPGSAWVWAIVSGVTGSQQVSVTEASANPGAVTDLQVVSSTGTSVTLRWTQVADGAGGAAHYALRRGSPTISWAGAAGTEVSVQGTQVGASTEYTWSGLTAGATYQFQLVAYRGTLGQGAVLGALSNTPSATTPTTPRVVAQVLVAPASATVTVGGTKQFTVTAFDSAGLSMPATNPTWGFTVPAVGTVNASGLLSAVGVGSGWVWAVVSGVTGSQEVSVTASASTPGTVSDLQVVSTTQTSVTLRWTQVSNGLGLPAAYALRRGSPTISWTSAVGTQVSVPGTQIGTTIQHTWSGLTAGSTHQFQLVAYRGTLGQGEILGSLSNVVSATLSTTPPPPPGPPPTGGIFFACSWPTAGTSNTAIQDCGTRDWSSSPFANASNTFSVISASGLNMPTTNALAVSARSGSFGILWVTAAQGYVPALAVGDSISRRFYFRVTLDSASPEDNLHATHDGQTTNNEDHNTSIEQFFDGSGNQWVIDVLRGPATGRQHIRLTSGRTLQRNVTYIYRDLVIRNSPTTSVFKVEIFNANGSPLYGASDFATNYGNGTNLSAGLSTPYGASNGADGYRQFQLGLNGIVGSQTGYAYVYGGFAICDGLCPVTYVRGEGGTP